MAAEGPIDPGRSALEGARRARGQIRRYCAANGLNRLGTLTYAGAGCHDEIEHRQNIGLFFRQLRRGLGGDRLPYVWVPEWHKGGHGLHAHFAVGQYVPRSVIGEAWDHGFFHIKLIGDLPVGAGAFAEARKAAGYLAKYVGKDFGRPKPGGLHDYDVAQGFQPRSVQLAGPNLSGVLAEAAELMGDPARYVWRSADQADRQTPPAVWAKW